MVLLWNLIAKGRKREKNEKCTYILKQTVEIITFSYSCNIVKELCIEHITLVLFEIKTEWYIVERIKTQMM
jgi:hypothetical protein